MTEKIKKILKKLLEIRASDYQIAAGVACGAAISFTPFVGFHLVLAILTALLLRANAVAAVAGTIVGNPWTFPFIWVSVLYTGEEIIGKAHSAVHPSFEELFKNMFSALKNLDFMAFEADIWPILHPMIIGSIPFYLLSWIITYIIVKKLLNKYRNKNNDNRNRN